MEWRNPNETVAMCQLEARMETCCKAPIFHRPDACDKFLARARRTIKV